MAIERITIYFKEQINNGEFTVFGISIAVTSYILFMLDEIKDELIK
jgi:hypothetical protein